MRRAAWIFFASIFLPSLGLAWLAIHSVRDQQVVLEHQQAIICQNIADSVAKSVQNQMDQARGDFVHATQQLLDNSASPQALAQNFNRSLHEAWPLAEIGFAVNLDGEIYSPKPYDGPEARTFRNENDSFLSNRENVEVYSSNSQAANQNVVLNQAQVFRNANNVLAQNAAAQFALKLPNAVANAAADQSKIVSQSNSDLQAAQQPIDSLAVQKKDERAEVAKAAFALRAMQVTATDQSPATTGSTATNSVEAALQQMPAAAMPAAASAESGVAASRGSIVFRTPPSGAARLDDSAAGAGKFETTSPQTTAEPEPAAPSSTVITALPATPADEAEEKMNSVPSTTIVNAAPVAPSDSTVDAGSAAPTASAESAPSTLSVPTAPSAIHATVIDAPAPAATEGGEFNNDISTSSANVFAKIQRQVIPQQVLARSDASLSNTIPEESDFRRVIGAETSGELARFLEDKMRLLVWSHATADAPVVFGAQLDLDKLTDQLQTLFQNSNVLPPYERTSFGETVERPYCVAILDDAGRPVVLSRPGFSADWKHPFVATEIGEVLPHWEAALYLIDPQQFSRAARTLQLTFGLIVLLLVAAIVSGGSIIARDVQRQTRLAQQKTDFVSNVSHELKTPLTSIRMFADLLAEKRVPDGERQETYLRIIAAEASRLTRLINNVLDFARLEKGAPHGQHDDCDLVDAVRDVAETCGPHLEAASIQFQCEIEAEALPLRGDRDELAQIILNLISNAEKYGGNDILVRVRRQEIASGALGCVDVLDRGAGIPARQVKTVFEPFHRLEDSLSSGIPGSGLGLTLARRMARAHGGDVTYSARAGGGSCFTLAVPLAKTN